MLEKQKKTRNFVQCLESALQKNSYLSYNDLIKDFNSVGKTDSGLDNTFDVAFTTDTIKELLHLGCLDFGLNNKKQNVIFRTRRLDRYFHQLSANVKEGCMANL